MDFLIWEAANSEADTSAIVNALPV
jgi:hypothetical protein